MNRKRMVTFGMAAVVAAMLGVVACQQAQPAAPPTQPAPAKAAAPTSAPAAPATAAPAAPAAVPTAAAASAPAATAAPAAATETIKVGLLSPITGPIARVGMVEDKLLRLGIEEVNAKGIQVGGKTYKFEPVAADTGYTAEGGRTAANRLVLNDKVKFLIGATTSDAPGAQTAAEPNNVLSLVMNIPVTGLGKDHPLTLQTGDSLAASRVPALYDALKKAHPDVKRIGWVMSDDPLGHNTGDSIEAAAKARGMTIVSKEFFPTDMKDFNPLVTRLMREKPEVVDVGGMGASPNVIGPLARALKDQGFTGVLQGTAGNLELYKSTGAVLDGYVVARLLDYNAPIVTQREKDLVNRYIKAYGVENLDVSLLQWYNPTLVLAQGIEKAGTIDDARKVADVLRAGEWETIYGKTHYVGTKTFGAPVVLELPLYMSRFEGGKGVTFDKVMTTMP